jgi:tRNA (guanine37-N1)-methyltransferase
VDERVLEARQIMEVSLGDFVLSGGEVAAMALMDAVVRTIPGVIGDATTLNEESFEVGLLEYPHYTRPKLWEGRDIPEVLQSGHHGKIKEWRLSQSEKLTQERRPDLWEKYIRGQTPKG